MTDLVGIIHVGPRTEAQAPPPAGGGGASCQILTRCRSLIPWTGTYAPATQALRQPVARHPPPPGPAFARQARRRPAPPEPRMEGTRARSQPRRLVVRAERLAAVLRSELLGAVRQSELPEAALRSELPPPPFRWSPALLPRPGCRRLQGESRQEQGLPQPQERHRRPRAPHVQARPRRPAPALGRASGAEASHRPAARIRGAVVGRLGVARADPGEGCGWRTRCAH
jgi:hypothetical protein